MTEDMGLPEEWVVKPLGQVAQLVKDKVDPSTVPDAQYVGLEHVEAHTMRLLGRGRGSDVRSAKTKFAAGDVLYGKLRPYLNKVARPLFDGISSTDFLVFTESPNLDPGYLAQFLNQLSVAEYAHHVSTGVELPRVDWKSLSTLSIAFPASKSKQRAIVAQIERARALSSGANTHLMQARQAIERFRDAVLTAACSGRLTADWREQNPDVEGAEMLVRQSTYRMAEPNEGLAELLADLPDKWAWVALGNYARCSRGRFSVRPRNDPSCFGGEHPFIQIGNLNPDGGWVRSHTQTLNAKGLSVSKKFPKGTVVIAIVGATIGNTGLLAYDMCFPDSLVGLETGTPEGNRFVELFLRDRKHAIRQASYSSGGQPNIKLESLNPYPLALPPLAEQREIVRRVETLFALAEKVVAKIDATSRRVDRTSQAVLAKAFRGELSA